MMAWFIYVEESQYIPFYVFLEKNSLNGSVVCLKQFLKDGHNVIFYIGKFTQEDADKLKKTVGVECFMLGPAVLWTKALL